MKIHDILVATDFSPVAEAAVQSALSLAGRLDASVHLLHVVESGFPAGMWASELYTTEIAAVQTTLVRDAEQHLRRNVASLDLGRLNVTSEVQAGRAAPTIANVAGDRGYGLIVMGTRGQTGLPHLLMGSVAEGVVRTASCPVLTVHVPRPALRTIVVATDFSPASDAALDLGASLAAVFGASLHLVHVVNDPFQLGGDAFVVPVPELRERLMESARRRLAENVASIRSVAATGDIVTDTAARGIVERAAQQDADLIVMGTRGLGAVAHALLGSVADRVMRTAPCPVLTVHAVHDPIRPEARETVAASIRRQSVGE